jgi:hypothetical protein
MNRIGPETRARVINCLIEGCSLRATVRMTGAAKNTVVNPKPMAKASMIEKNLVAKALGE